MFSVAAQGGLQCIASHSNAWLTGIYKLLHASRLCVCSATDARPHALHLAHVLQRAPKTIHVHEIEIVDVIYDSGSRTRFAIANARFATGTPA